MTNVASINPRLMPFNTRPFFSVVSFNGGSSDGELFNLDLPKVVSLRVVLSDQICLSWDLGAEMLLEGDVPGIVV